MVIIINRKRKRKREAKKPKQPKSQNKPLKSNIWFIREKKTSKKKIKKRKV